MLHGARAILGRPPLKARHGLEFPTDPSEFTEFKYAISLRADSIPVSAGMQLTGDAACEFWCGCGGPSRVPRGGVAERHRPGRDFLDHPSKLERVYGRRQVHPKGGTLRISPGPQPGSSPCP